MKTKSNLPARIFPIVLVGLPGAGKTAVARELANLLQVVGVDADAEVRRRTRRSIEDIFAAEGEAAFRKREYEAIVSALSTSQGVISLGGGALTYDPTREALKGHTVIYLATSPTEAARRVGDGGGRPLLKGDPLAKLTELAQHRENGYEQAATFTVPTDGLSVEQVARRCYEGLRQKYSIGHGQVSSMTGITTIHVGGGRPYEVRIGEGILAEISNQVSARSVRALLVHPPVMADAAQAIVEKLHDAGCKAQQFVTPDGEEAKDLAVVQACWETLGKEMFDRKDVVVGLGGGATTDMAGFAAATWLRGIDVIQVPTTLLGMVDAAVGGKTGINSTAGKNMIGAFHPPLAVICDLKFLETLPEAEIKSGLGEVVKCGFIADPQILRLIGAVQDQSVAGVKAHLPELIERAVKVKARVVTADLRESGLREILNYGHTLAHAIEKVENYKVRHGEAVSIGMVYAAEIAHRLGMLDSEEVAMHREMATICGLPTSYNSAKWEEIKATMYSDKKVRSSALRFVLLKGMGCPQVTKIEDEDLLHSAFLALST